MPRQRHDRVPHPVEPSSLSPANSRTVRRFTGSIAGNAIRFKRCDVSFPRDYPPPGERNQPFQNRPRRYPLREPGRMAKLADARDLKSRGGKPPCGFDPRSGHWCFFVQRDAKQREAIQISPGFLPFLPASSCVASRSLRASWCDPQLARCGALGTNFGNRGHAIGHLF